MYFVKDKKCSIHYHIKKTETFHCLEGEFRIRFYDDLNEIKRIVNETDSEEKIEKALETIYMKPGDTLFIPPGRVHQITGLLRENKLLEVSTQDFKEDSIKLVKGD